MDMDRDISRRNMLALSAAAVTVICIASAFVSILKVIRLEPAIVFKG